mmetsp:Transcript_134287/g.268011  ORF Transcript_134287/g.268011 Transcript_134287/m.268011 type:complete len:536 (+) Transcript_134287:147-1754(+)
MLINEDIHAAFAGLRTAVEKSEEAVKVIQQVEQAKLREAVRAEAEATKMAELAALETKAATLEAEAAREAQHLAEARSDRLTEKLQNKREEVRKLDELLEKFEDKLQEKRREAKAMEEYVDKLEALVQKERRGGTGGTKTGSQPAAARASSPGQAENYDQESYVSRSRTPSPAGPDRTPDDSARDGTDGVTKTDWDRAGNEQRPIPGMKAASEHEDSECEICKREDSVPRPAGSKDQESGTGRSREVGEKEKDRPSGEAREEVGPEGGATTGRVGSRACSEENERPLRSRRPSLTRTRSPDREGSRKSLQRSAGRRDGDHREQDRSCSRVAPSSCRSRPRSRQRHRSNSGPSNRSHSRQWSHSKPRRRSNSRQRSHMRRSRSAQSHSRRRSPSGRRSHSRSPRRDDERRREERIEARGLGTRRDRSRTARSRRDSGYYRRGSGRSRSASNRYSRGRKGKGSGKNNLCFYYILDKCRKGDNCYDSHPDKSEVKTIREKLERTPCRFGVGCTRRDCIFKHPPGRNLDNPPNHSGEQL